jgi:DNA-binding transcriptional MerR regulator
LRIKGYFGVQALASKPSDLTIGRLARRTDCNVPTIRYYEQIGLLPKAGRGPGGHRVYSDADLRRLTFIRRCREFEFSIDQIRELVGLIEHPERDCIEAAGHAKRPLNSVRKKLVELHALERSLSDYAKRCEAECAGGPAGDCVMLEDLATRSNCCGNG